MSRAVWQATIADAFGNAVPTATVTVRDAETGDLVPLYSVLVGAGGLSNPFFADGEGFARFYVETGSYDITVVAAGDTRELVDVAIGAAGGGGGGGGDMTGTEILDALSTLTAEGDVLYDPGTGLEATDFAALVAAFGNVPTVRGASWTGFNQAVQVPVQDVAVPIPFDATIVKVIVLTQGGTGSCTVDIWNDAFASYPPDVGDTICASAKPTITSGTKFQDTTLTGWTTAVSAGDVLNFHLQGNSVFTGIAVFVILQAVDSSPADGYTDERAREIAQEVLADGGITVAGDVYTVTGMGSSGPVNLWSLVGQPSGVVTINYTTPPGGMYSNLPGIPALDLRGFASGSEVVVTARGPVFGCPGRGADGAALGNTFGEDGGSGRRGITGTLAHDGENGGPAVIGPGAGIDFSVSAVGGYFFGGGGGGGGGGGSLDFGGDTNAAAGGGGGAGAGGTVGGRGGRIATSNASSGSSTSAASGGYSTGGLGSSPGSGGIGADNGSATGGDGGDGGNWGASGGDGDSPTGSDRDYAGGTAGTGGKAIDLNGGSVTILDGNDSTHIKGAVS